MPTPPPDRLFHEPLRPGVVLQEEQIRQMVEAGKLIRKDLFDARGLDAVSYDIRIGARAILGGKGNVIDLTKESLEIDPGGYAAVLSHEYVTIPSDILVRINAKRSFSYEGIALLTGMQVDPGYEGHLLFGFYNASSRKAVLPRLSPICSLVFEALAGPVSRPKRSDEDLVMGQFPARFVQDMARMEVVSLQELRKNIKVIEQLANDILDLRGKYENVLEPIRTLTSAVDRLTQDVKAVSTDVGIVNSATGENARQVSELSTAIKLLMSEISHVKDESKRISGEEKTQREELTGLAKNFGRFSLLVYIFWGMLLVGLGALLPKLW